MRKFVERFLKPKTRDTDKTQEETEVIIRRVANGECDTQKIEKVQEVITEAKKKMKFAIVLFLALPILGGCMSAAHQQKLDVQTERIKAAGMAIASLKAEFATLIESIRSATDAIADGVDVDELVALKAHVIKAKEAGAAILAKVKEQEVEIKDATAKIGEVKEASKSSWIELAGSLLFGALGLRGAQSGVARKAVGMFMGGPGSAPPTQ